MVCWSQFPSEFQDLSCRTISHPWTDSCFKGAIRSSLESVIGSGIFFSILYSCQYVSALLKKKKKANPRDYLIRFLKSTLFGTSVSGGTFIWHCFIRNLLGRYYQHTSVFIPAFIGGLAVFFENRKGQELAMNAFANCALELFLRTLERSNILRWTPNSQTVTFMIVSSFLSSLLNWTKFDLNYFWFFIPPKADGNSENEVCFHRETCKKHITKLFIMYSSTGLLLQFLNLFMKNLKNPKMILLSLKSPKVFKLAAFLGGYVLIYQAIRCFLYQKEKKYSLSHDTLAGFLAGAAFRFQPTIQIFNSAVITIIQILSELAWQRKVIPDLPYLEIVFATLCGLLFHFAIFLGEYCPQLMLYITSTVTHGMSERVAATYKKILEDSVKKT